MTPTVHLSCFLALLVASLAQGIKGSLRSQDPGPRPLELKEVFALFQTQYNRSYLNPAEHARRLNIFAHNLARAQQQQEEDLGTAKFGVTPFSDLTERDPEDQRSGCLSQIAESTDKYSGEEEFGQLYGHPVAAGRAPNMDRKVGSDEWSESVPPTCDWRKKSGVISSVKDQKNCKCCWAMAAAGNIEALWGIKHHQPVEVSVQELVDCTRCGNGCEGGFIWDAFITVLNNSGLASEKDYPYQGKVRTHKCQAKKHKNVAWIQDFIMLPDCEMKIARYLATEGPITVTINMKLLQQYQTGVIKATSNTCDPHLVDHSVLLVGFGKSKSVAGRRAEAVSSKSRHSIPYWILKNSWGASWGEKGYFRLHRGSNTCGITKYPLTARVTHPVKRKQQLVSCPP